MIIRSINKYDVAKVTQIHKRFYAEEFELPDFVTNYLASFVIEGLNGEIVNVTGIKTILEVVSMTNRDIAVVDRKVALEKILEVSSFIADQRGYNQLHAFVQDVLWERHLKGVGFKDTRGKSLVLEIPHG